MKIGILGGTFDPIHYGHIKPAIEVKQQLNLDKIWLMPNHIPPHKQTTKVSSEQRLAMAELVCQQYDELEVCDIEINRDSPSYTVTTLELLTQRYPQHQFYFIMGTDSFIQLASWYQWQQLFALCHLVVCRRPGWSASHDHPMMQLLKQKQVDCQQAESIEAKVGNIFPVEVTLQDISSTEIRAQLTQIMANETHLPTQSTKLLAQSTHFSADGSLKLAKGSLNKKLPACIQAYILQHQLYR
ncbi:nicotinate-nucleotide adenylyltransferase [Shewanella sp. 4_MG-2023]|nr:nicotinate-nucleotide adenylyltransferase [Shewanella sp. 4_MG-2023]MDO6676938.1 nicotinate-nucleotide adenylyltransferase [Shewanella sp. 4_MG-2023]